MLCQIYVIRHISVIAGKFKDFSESAAGSLFVVGALYVFPVKLEFFGGLG